MASEKEDPLANLSRPWQKFFAKFDELDEIKVSRWTETHLLGYVCERFENLHGRKFAVTLKGPPSKSPDIVVIKKMMSMLGTSNMNTCKDYIDWVFDKKVIPNNVKFRKVGFLISAGFANEFAFDKEKMETISRHTNLPESFAKIANELEIDVKTYGDLAFLQMSVERKQDKTHPSYILLSNLESLGLDLNQLKELSE